MAQTGLEMATGLHGTRARTAPPQGAEGSMGKASGASDSDDPVTFVTAIEALKGKHRGPGSAGPGRLHKP
jgi:hypothetical protein